MGKSNNQKPNTPSAKPQSSAKADDNGLERNKYVYEQVNGWIENADNKVSVSCGIFTGAFGVITYLAERYIIVPDNPVINECWKTIYGVSFGLSLFVMVLAVFFYALSIIPNLKSSGKMKPTRKKYPIFYGDIHSLQQEDYQRLMEKGTDKDFNDELVLESWHNSGICLKKMKWYKAGVITSMIAIALALFTFGAHLLAYQ